MGSGRVVLAAVLVGLCLALSPGQAHALSCGLARPVWFPVEKLVRSEVVLVGSERSASLRYEEAWDGYSVWTEYEVLQVWKGNLPEVVSLETDVLRQDEVGAHSWEPSIEPMLIYSDGEYVFFGYDERCESSGRVWWTRRDLLEFAAFYVVLTALSFTVLLLTLSKALRSYHERFLAR